MAKPRAGMAMSAVRKHLDRAFEAASNRGRGAWDRQVQGEFGHPGTERKIRDYPVSQQQRVIADYQALDVANRKPKVARAWGNIHADGLGAMDELLPVALNTSARSTNTARPRALRGGYDSRADTVRIQYRDGAVYEYYQVPGTVWRKILRGPSTGKTVDQVLDTYAYSRIDPSTGRAIGIFSTNSAAYAGGFDVPGGGLAGVLGFHADEETEFGGFEQERPDEGWYSR